MRYAGADNFIGKPVPGYDGARMRAGQAGRRGAEERPSRVSGKGFTLKVYDCYRPARAVAAFVHWAKEPDDPKAKIDLLPQSAQVRLCSQTISPRAQVIRAAPRST